MFSGMRALVLSIAVVAVVVAAAAAAAAAAATDGTAVNPEVFLAQLVTDLDLVKQSPEAEEVEDVEVPFNQGRFRRRDKETKDRYEALYQSHVRKSKVEREENPMLGKEFVREQDQALWDQLYTLYTDSWLATRGDWRSILFQVNHDRKKMLNFRNKADLLQVQHRMLVKQSKQEGKQRRFDSDNDFLDLDNFVAGEDVDADATFATADVLQRTEARLFNSSYLPTHAELMSVFTWLDSSKQQPAFDLSLLEEDLSKDEPMTFQTPLDWIYFFSNGYRKQCEIWNEEYLEALSSYIASRLTPLLHANQGAPINVLEVGAGDGRLTHFLKKLVTPKLEAAIADRVHFVATDIGGRKGDIFAAFPVEKLSSDDSLTKYQPAIVLCSWMSMGVDLTQDFKETDSVQEYVLIGETDFGVSGHPSRTWGMGVDESTEVQTFERVELDGLSVFQIGRSDTPLIRFHSRTISFRRAPAQAHSTDRDYHDEL